MTDEQKSALTCALRLLFDGKTPTELGNAIHDALGDQSWNVLWHLEAKEPIAILSTEDDEGVRCILQGNDKEFIGTDEDMFKLLKHLSSVDFGDYTYDVMYNARSEAISEYLNEHPGLVQEITPEVTP